MKSKLRLLLYPVIFAGIILVSIGSCKKDTKPAADCVDSDDGCSGTFKTCCSATQCYYTYKGTTYNCDGTDCYDAAIELAGAIMDNCAQKTTGATATPQEIKAKANEILNRVNQ